VYFQKDNTGPFRDLGNALAFSVENQIEKKEHFRFYGGSRKKDKTVVVQVGATVKFTLDEITPDNLSFFALSDAPATDTDDNMYLIGLSNTEFTGTLRFVGDNDVGPQLDWEGQVSFNPAGEFSFLNDAGDFSTIAVEAEVEDDGNGNFGLWTHREQS
jgi:hypothetical protein